MRTTAELWSRASPGVHMWSKAKLPRPKGRGGGHARLRAAAAARIWLQLPVARATGTAIILQLYPRPGTRVLESIAMISIRYSHGT